MKGRRLIRAMVHKHTLLKYAPIVLFAVTVVLAVAGIAHAERYTPYRVPRFT